MAVRIALCVLWLLALPLPASAYGEETLLIIGDSLSDHYGMSRESGWAYQLGQRLEGEYAVINASISGETTAGALSRLDRLLETHSADRLLIILGGNDGLRALNPSQVKDNLARIIERADAAGAAVALMQVRLPPNLGPAYLRRFESIYPALAESHGIPLLPFFLENLFDQPGMMMNDGIHPTEQAQPLMLDELWPALREWLDES